MSYLSQYTLATDGNFLQKVEQAAITAAIQIQAEAGATPNHGDRSNLALRVLQNPQGWALLMAKAVASNVAITGASLDSDIQFTVNANWNAFAVQAV